MDETEFRAAIVREAKTWIGTPYRSTGCIKGVGTNCAQFLFAVAKDAAILPPDAPAPRWFTPQLATHTREERLAEYFVAYGAREIRTDEAKPGDLVLYKSGQAHGHAAVLVGPREIVHVMPGHGCQLGDVYEGRLGQLARRFFTLWKD